MTRKKVSKRVEWSCFFRARFKYTETMIKSSFYRLIQEDMAPFSALKIQGGRHAGYLEGCLHLMLSEKEGTEERFTHETAEAIAVKLEHTASGLESPAKVAHIEFEELTVAHTRKVRRKGHPLPSVGPGPDLAALLREEARYGRSTVDHPESDETTKGEEMTLKFL